ncbi:MAG TPA: hypothetical protein VKE51_04745 [Vicinamibacterales bacterium]|nr:hypothetical protein [Vicinamibacterales bacterium]
MGADSDGSRSTRRRGRLSARCADDVERFTARRQRIGKPNLDERLAGHAESPGFGIDRAQQIHWKVDIDTLHLTARPARLLPVDILVDPV